MVLNRRKPVDTGQGRIQFFEKGGKIFENRASELVSEAGVGGRAPLEKILKV